MLELKKISKVYQTGNFKQKALDKVSINFRQNEFVAILGPSGSGKTTLLNIIGGLDDYNSGDLIINGISTKNYKNHDWDIYRNWRVGFVFQSYNLISHQTILANVELALTLSGVPKKERKRRAKQALTKVGLGKHLHKKPNQLSGGQMQRVAIARALVNDPDIILADEPTGALDSETSVQIMNLLKEVAKEKLVIMVTHNPELASDYANRIINIKDGKITSDTNPYDNKDGETEETGKQKTSMSLKTALGLSLNNLMTKKGRTILTAFAGSIGIIGIALILSLSNGVQEYISKVEKETLSEYPITIQASSIDFESIISKSKEAKKETTCDEGKICSKDDITNDFSLALSNATVSNNLEEFKKYLDDNGGNINKYTTDIQYGYNLDLQVYTNDGNYNLVNSKEENNNSQMNSSFMPDNNVFQKLIDNKNLLNSQYDILAGRMPEKYNEVVFIADENNNIPESLLYDLGLKDKKELTEITKKISEGENVEIKSSNYSYDDILNLSYKLILNTYYYEKENGLWVNKNNDEDYMHNIIDNGIDIKIVGVLKVNEEATTANSGIIGYTHELTEHVIKQINETDIAKEQLNNKNINVFTGEEFDNLSNSYEENLNILGIADLENPSTINIYPKDFESKEKIEDIINDYNEKKIDNNEENLAISYTDIVGTMMSSITTIINNITYILIGFVAVSLIVSSIMIAIITYISVLERTKEIGILRAIGASKKDISRVFNAETLIEGFISGVFGILITLLICIPINIITKDILEVSGIASLPVTGAIFLIILSVVLTVISGFIPAKLASKKDPVEALRSE